MTGTIHLFWSTTSHGTAGAVLGWLALCGAADVVATVTTWLRKLAATVAREIRLDRGHPADVIPLDRGEDEARAAAGHPARDGRVYRSGSCARSRRRGRGGAR